MRSVFTVVLTSALTLCVSAQIPLGSSPSTKDEVGVAYGNTTVTPGVWIDPSSVVDQPSIYELSKSHPNSTFMLFMLDLNIPDSDVTTAEYYGTLVPGLAMNTTTRLHWWAGNLTASGCFLVNSSDALAPYTAPRPRDTTNHTYTFYLFDQPASYIPPVEVLEGEYYDQTTNARFNFSLAEVVRLAGSPIAANYFLSSA